MEGRHERIRALLVGVDRYAEPQVPVLRGCVNERATKAQIMRRLHEIIDASRPGDVVVFYFSGHGSQIRDRDGDELSDALDELLCPYDMDWDERRYIVDDEFDEIV